MHHLAAHELEECGPLPCVLLGEQIHDSVAREGFPVETPCAREPRGSLATTPPGFPLATPPRFPGSAAARVLQAPPPGSIQIESPPPHHIDSPPPRHLVNATPASHRRRAGIPSPSAPASRLLCPGFPSPVAPSRCFGQANSEPNISSHATVPLARV